MTPSIHEVGFDQYHGIEDDGERAMSNDNNYISHENEGEKKSKPTRFGDMHVDIIECNRYQKRLTRPIHEVGFDQNHAIEDAGKQAISNDNNYISHENEDDKHSKLTRFKTLHVYIIECNLYQKRLTRSIHEVGFLPKSRH